MKALPWMVRIYPSIFKRYNQADLSVVMMYANCFSGGGSDVTLEHRPGTGSTDHRLRRHRHRHPLDYRLSQHQGGPTTRAQRRALQESCVRFVVIVHVHVRVSNQRAL